jgi:hypothetical protein
MCLPLLVMLVLVRQGGPPGVGRHVPQPAQALMGAALSCVLLTSNGDAY